MRERDRRRAAEFAALMAARDKRRQHPRNVDHAARNAEEWARHRAHASLWPVESCRICMDCPRDFDPYESPTPDL